ncbi:hypothetical protein AJ79_03421 [Helicocarpus griseus UAMH5409]|uniref:SGNH hydrolase-type esterase domain-containing protein n=1 Tax=Helicocarpus griseus UAMH5409 TaxID=1447875 RepID=A0A2B7XYJ5_9EURO|nr:hypothetical protein AJ79_03421 [Helicocarpus griseus UAMH5409]
MQSNNTPTGGYNWLHWIASTPVSPDSGNNVTAHNYAVSGAVTSQTIAPLHLLVPGKTIPDSIDCIYTALDELYAAGARYFILMNIPPMQLAPLYAPPERGGVGETWAWPDKPENITRVSGRMGQLVTMWNEVLKYRTGFEVLVKKSWEGSRVGVMDVYGLMMHIYNNPTEHLAAPANVTGYINHCNVDTSECHRLENPESFMWFDYSHPSERTERIIAQQFLDVVRGESEWATYFTS